jgi:hypothetical protein
MCKRGEYEILSVPYATWIVKDTTPNPKEVKIDKCLVPQIKQLWLGGVRTYGCCCQHGNPDPYMPQNGFISIHFDDLNKALVLGFEELKTRRKDPTAPCYALKIKQEVDNE